MRAFLAIRLPESTLEGMVAAQRAIEGGAPGFYRWVGREQMHLTLYFLGESEVEPIVDVVQGLKADPFEILVEGLALLPEPNSPRIVAAGIGGDVQALTRLQQRLSDTVFPFSAFKETRRYYPHITLGRIKHGKASNAKALKRTLGKTTIAASRAFRIEEFELIGSVLGPGGPQYETLHRFALG